MEQDAQSAGAAAGAYEEGKSLYRAGRYEEAAKAFDAVIALDPAHANAFLWRGYVHRALGLQERALEDFDALISVAPSLGDGYCERGRVRSVMNDPGALADFDKAIELDPQFAFAHLHRGLHHAKLGNAGAAREDLERALGLGLEGENSNLAREHLRRLSNPRKYELLDKYLRPVPVAPRLRTLNGDGLDILETHRDEDLAPKFFGMYGRRFFGFPASVRAIYLLSHPVRADGSINYNAYVFHGELTSDQFEEIYPEGLSKMKGTAIITGIIAVAIAGAIIVARRLSH